jgi:L-lactate dehydrogenase complex protein LldG
MSAARDEILHRVRQALADVAGAPEIDVPRAYRVRGELDDGARVALLVERLREYRAEVVESEDPRGAVEDALARHGARRVVTDRGLPRGLRPGGVELVVDGGATPRELDLCDAAVTTCAAACAETGTLALDGGPGQGRRALTLVPDLHVCVVGREQVVQTVPELFDRLEPSARAGRPLVLVSGPSATSDIELARVEGVHGPRRLVVVIAPA